ncbi:MAG: Rid family detoxifying hydrolase [Actinomycetes bacterium]
MSGDRQTHHSPDAPAAVGPYSHAASAAGLVFASGQLGLDPASGQLVEGGVEAQARQALSNLKAVAEAAGTQLDRAVKVNVYLTDMGDFQAVNAIYAEFFPGEDPPARAAVAVKALPLGGLVEVDAILAA